MRPMIGITTERERATWGDMVDEVDLLSATYADMVAAAGGCPLLVPLRSGYEAELLAHLDGLVVSGGPDIAAERYGAIRHIHTEDVRPDRDELELSLLASFIEAGRPVLAICRGAQLLNVLRGGDLVQHLPDVLEGGRRHGLASAPLCHAIELLPDSALAAALGTTAEARCSHHQAMNRLGDGLRVVARADDGVIEAVELGDHPFAVAVQWHPEESGHVQLFEALVMASASHRDAANALSDPSPDL